MSKVIELIKRARAIANVAEPNKAGQKAIVAHLDDALIKFEKLLTVLDPIREWYGGGTEGNRPDIEILTDAVADLQKDRKQLLNLQSEVERLKEKIKIVQIGDIKPPEFTPTIPVLRLDLCKPENAFLYGWEAAIVECGEILSKALKGGGQAEKGMSNAKSV